MAMCAKEHGLKTGSFFLILVVFIISTAYIVFGNRLQPQQVWMFGNPDPLPAVHHSYRVNTTGFPSPAEDKPVDILKLFQRIQDRKLVRCSRPRTPILKEKRKWQKWPHVVHRFHQLRMNPELVSSHVHGQLKCCSGAEKLKTLGDDIQARLLKLQNPPDCTQAKRVLFKTQGKHGMGSTMHLLGHGLMLALATNRTLIIIPSASNYGADAWRKYILPLGSCPVPSNVEDVIGNDWDMSPIVQAINGFPPRGMTVAGTPNLPRHILKEFQGLDCDPGAWWTGQFMRYIFRPRDQIAKEIQRRMESFHAPIAGVQIRRGDKLVYEAGKHAVEEYMDEVEKYFDKLDSNQHSSNRTVFVATDDASAIDEIAIKYPNYTVIGDRDHAKTATKGYTATSLAEMIVDLSLLVQTNFVVCTFSSNICRMVYELMMSKESDVCLEVQSLDCQYNFDQTPLPLIANSDHTSSSEYEISFKKGDPIFTYGFVGEGYSAGINHNGSTDILGVFPSYKVSSVFLPLD